MPDTPAFMLASHWLAPCDAPAQPSSALAARALPLRCDAPDMVHTLSELSVDKKDASTPETLHPWARVMVLRLLDGKIVWDGFSDAAGRWRADGLQPGYEYVAVGIDQTRHFKATAAGPILGNEARAAAAQNAEGVED